MPKRRRKRRVAGHLARDGVAALLVLAVVLGQADHHVTPREPVAVPPLERAEERLGGVGPRARGVGVVENLDWGWHGAKGSLAHRAIPRVGLAAPPIVGEQDGECRRRRWTLVGAMILATAPPTSPPPTPKRRRVLVHLTGRNGLIPVQRDVPRHGRRRSSRPSAPCCAARRRSSSPTASAPRCRPAAQLLGVDVEDGVATVDLAPAFAAGGATASVRRRVQQLVHTATACAGHRQRAPAAGRRAGRHARRRRPAGVGRADPRRRPTRRRLLEAHAGCM